MKIFDCTTYFNEPLIMDVRFNGLDKFIEKFIIVESTYSHSGAKKEINFDKNKFPKFKDKITHLIIENDPTESNNELNDRSKSIKRLSYQRDYKRCFLLAYKLIDHLLLVFL